MNTSTGQALILILVMGATIFFCRVFPFLFFTRDNEAGISGRRSAFLNFVEKTVPPAAMTVLAFNILGSAFRENPFDGLPALAASVFTILLHLWKKNSLISIFGGTALYMIFLQLW